jgi:hypothetical protein
MGFLTPLHSILIYDSTLYPTWVFRYIFFLRYLKCLVIQ